MNLNLNLQINLCIPGIFAHDGSSVSSTANKQVIMNQQQIRKLHMCNFDYFNDQTQKHNSGDFYITSTE